MNVGRKIVFVVAGVILLFVPFASTVSGFINEALAQSAAPAPAGPAFEVTSIKPNHTANPREFIQFPAGRLTATAVTTKTLIQFAYNLQDFQISAGPNWVGANRYDVDAKEDESTARALQNSTPFQRADQIRLLLQALLADRFALKLTHQYKEVPTYALVVAKDGPKLSQTTLMEPEGSSAAQGQSPKGPRIGITGRGQINGTGVPVNLLAELLSRQLGRRVVDKTGLSGNYDFTLQWTPDETQPQAPSASEGDAARLSSSSPAPASADASLFTALQEQLGLRLESQRGSVDVVVIDHIEEPSPN